jgi:hypothetical protein
MTKRIFLKERSKKLYFPQSPPDAPLTTGASHQWQKFFGSFFQKRTAS